MGGHGRHVDTLLQVFPSYLGWFNVYLECCGYFKVFVCRCHSWVQWYHNLELMTIIVKILIKTNNTLNNACLRPELEISNWLTKLKVLYTIRSMHAFCFEHWTEVLHFCMSCIACKLGNGATNRGPTIEFKPYHSEMKAQSTNVKSPLMSNRDMTFLCLYRFPFSTKNKQTKGQEGFSKMFLKYPESWKYLIPARH